MIINGVVYDAVHRDHPQDGKYVELIIFVPEDEYEELLDKAVLIMEKGDD